MIYHLSLLFAPVVIEKIFIFAFFKQTDLINIEPNRNAISCLRSVLCCCFHDTSLVTELEIEQNFIAKQFSMSNLNRNFLFILQICPLHLFFPAAINKSFRS